MHHVLSLLSLSLSLFSSYRWIERKNYALTHTVNFRMINALHTTLLVFLFTSNFYSFLYYIWNLTRIDYCKTWAFPVCISKYTLVWYWKNHRLSSPRKFPSVWKYWISFENIFTLPNALILQWPFDDQRLIDIHANRRKRKAHTFLRLITINVGNNIAYHMTLLMEIIHAPWINEWINILENNNALNWSSLFEICRLVCSFRKENEIGVESKELVITKNAIFLISFVFDQTQIHHWEATNNDLLKN